MNKRGVLLFVATLYVAACELSSGQKLPRDDVGCICTFDYTPVCGSNGKTYPNACALGCKQRDDPTLQVKHQGPCGSAAVRATRAAPTCACTREYAPQCGSNGVTYNNPCLMRCAASGGIRKVHSGPCGGRKARAAQTPIEVPPCPCTRERNPQCGTDGVTYANPCLLRCAAKVKDVQLKHPGPCDGRKTRAAQGPVGKPSCLCTTESNPQCGSDGDTYTNPCILQCAAKVTGVQLKHPGPCGGRKVRAAQNANKVAPCPCTKELNPQCGTDGVTYGNPCSLRCASKVKDVKLKHPGSCGGRKTRAVQAPIEVPLCPCTKENNPQCGTDGVTYANPCLLRCAAKVKDIQLKHPGSCGERKARAAQNPIEPLCACPKNLRIVCGTDGKTYLNLCLLECSAKLDNSISLLHEGPCEISRKTRGTRTPVAY